MGHSLVVAALAASILVLVVQNGGIYPIVAVAVSGIEALLSFGIVHVSISHLWLILGIALAVVGVMIYLRSSAKPAVAASAIIALVGALQVWQGLR
jgi:glucose dehydrogenase